MFSRICQHWEGQVPPEAHFAAALIVTTLFGHMAGSWVQSRHALEQPAPA